MRLRIGALVIFVAFLVSGAFPWPHALALEDRLTWWSGAAFVTPIGGVEEPAFDGMAVHDGDVVRAADEGRVTITFRDGSLASLEPGTTVRVERAEVADGEAAISLTVERGRAWSSLPRNGYEREYAVRTDLLTATATGTAFDVIRDADGSTVVTFEGRVLGGGGRAVPSGTWQRMDAGGTTSGPNVVDRMLRFSAGAGARLIVTDPFGRSCGDVPGVGELRQIPGCVVSRGTDPVLVDLHSPDAGGSFIVTVVPGASGSATVGVATLAGGVVTSRGSVTARGAGMMASRLEVATDGVGPRVSRMTELAPIAAAPVRGPLVTAVSPGIAIAGSAPDPDVFPTLLEAPDATTIPVVGEAVGLPSPTPTFTIPSLPLPTVPPLASPATEPSPAAPATPTEGLAVPTSSPSTAPPSSAAPPPGGSSTPPPSGSPAPTTSLTPVPTESPSPSLTPAPSPTPAPTATPPPTVTPAPTPTPTPRPTGVVTMTNVAGSAVAGSDCATATASGTCATIFALADMRPGDTDEVNTVTITYRGTETVTVRLYASAIESPSSSSSASCTAPDPAAAVELRITSGGAVYPSSGYGDVSEFASTYADLASGLVVRASGASTDDWSDGDSATFTFAVRLSAAAGNDHQGCASAITFAWYASTP